VPAAAGAAALATATATTTATTGTTAAFACTQVGFDFHFKLLKKMRATRTPSGQHHAGRISWMADIRSAHRQ
jgi:hypothetical protein